MKVLRLLSVFLLSFLLAFCFPCAAHAQSFEEEIAEKSGAQELSDALDGETRGLVEEMEEGDLFSVLSSLLKDKLNAPFQTFALLAAVLILCRLAACFGEGMVSSTAALAGSLVCAVAVVSPILSLMHAAARTVESASVFLLAAAPVYGGLLIASGAPTAGSTYSALTLLLGNAVPVLSTSLIFPALQIFLALSVAASLSSMKLSALTDSLYSFLKWLLVLSVTLFSGALSVQTFLNAQVDAAASKAVKLMTSAAVPIVGGAIGDAAAAIYNSIGLVKSGAGAFGILALLCIFLPTVIEAVLWSCVCAAGQLTADLLEAPKLSALLKLCGSVAKMILAVLAATCAVSVVAAAIVLCVKGAGT